MIFSFITLLAISTLSYGENGTVVCDTIHKTLTIVSGQIPDDWDLQNKKTVDLDELLQYGYDRSTGKDFVKKLTKKNISCRLGKNTYHLTVFPWKYNYNTMGECGADEPVVGVTVTRSKIPLMQHVNFVQKCSGQGLAIKYLIFSEPACTVTIGYFDQDSFDIRINRADYETYVIPYAQLKSVSEDHDHIYAQLPKHDE
jgi:hypothetical protein